MKTTFNFLFLAVSITLLPSCKKDVNSDSVYRKSLSSDIINKMGLINGLEYVDLLNDFHKPKDAAIHIQSFNTLGNQMEGGFPSLSFSACVPDTNSKQISLFVNSNEFSYNGGYALTEPILGDKKAAFQNIYGSEIYFKLQNANGIVSEFTGSLPKQPKIFLNEYYKPGVGLNHNAATDLLLSWEPDNTNTLGGVLITISSEKNDQTTNILTPDNGSFSISSDILGKFKGRGLIDIAINRGAYKRFNITDMKGDTKSLCYYGILHTHLGVTLQ